MQSEFLPVGYCNRPIQHDPLNELYNLQVNGEKHEVRDAWVGESLLFVLRERLGLPGTKGCLRAGRMRQLHGDHGWLWQSVPVW